MDFVSHLWPAILASAAAAWFWSFLSWAMLRVHAGDFKGVPDEPRFLELIRELNLPPEYYSFPHMTKESCKDPAMKERWKTGPLGILHVWSPKFSMGRNMILTYLVYTVVSFLIAYVGDIALPHGSPFARVMQVTGTMGVLAYSFAFLPGMIWFQGRPRVMFTSILDGVVQGLATGAVFAAMWPRM
jgi:hypothetical protein